jgi:hypothetical protein
MANLKTLIKEYNFKYDIDYFYMVYDGYINGQFSQAHEQIRILSKKDKKTFLHRVIFSFYDMDKNAKEWLIKHIIELI